MFSALEDLLALATFAVTPSTAQLTRWRSEDEQKWDLIALLAHLSQEVSSHSQNWPVTVSGVWQIHFPHSQDPRPEQRGAEGGEVGGLKGWCTLNSGIKKVREQQALKAGKSGSRRQKKRGFRYTCKSTQGSAGWCGCQNTRRSVQSSLG